MQTAAGLGLAALMLAAHPQVALAAPTAGITQVMLHSSPCRQVFANRTMTGKK
jgi:hypothetical protein